MKKNGILFVVLPAALLAAGVYRHPGMNSTAVPPGPGFAVVELFTSEGCSSGPPADELLTRLVAEHKENVFVLGYHVDYWDRLGWKDAYSSAEYTRRQQQYARELKLSSIYTPQIVVNGQKEMVGSQEKGLRAVIAEDLARPAGKKIALRATTEGGIIRGSFTVEGRGDDDLYIALLQSHAETKVGAGENSGRRLQHVNIVRALKTASAGKAGSVDFTLPRGLQAKDCSLIALLQSNKGGDLSLTGAAAANIP